jgi:predicted ribosome quality control (RQC) complex YloA/Tae2 family protein
MSLNCEEIELILSEEPLEGMKIQNIFQPSYDSIVFELYGRGNRLFYLISIAHNACRLHPLSAPPVKNERPLRFMECLRSRIKGGTIVHAEQISKDRIIKIDIAKADEKGSLARLFLYARLWSGAGNVMLVSEDGIIIDALRRLPSRQEVSGAAFSLSAPRSALNQSAKPYTIRDLQGQGPFWQRIEHFYSEHTGQLSRDVLIAQAREIYSRTYSSLENRLSALSAKQQEYTQAERFRQIGDILIGGYALEVQGTKTFARALDFYENREILIEIEPSATPAQNAARYYEKYHKAKNGIDDIAAQLERCKASMRQLKTWLSRLEAEPDPIVVAQALRKGGAARPKEKMRFPCQHIEYKGWTILIGKSGKENDEILRHIARGSDLWLHARDYSGSYVFIRAIKNKSFPPEVIQTAARLAIYYSKARKNLGGDVHTTYVKNLRRVKDGPAGLVIPYLEKNIYISFTEAQIKEILDESISEEEMEQ